MLKMKVKAKKRQLWLYGGLAAVILVSLSGLGAYIYLQNQALAHTQEAHDKQLAAYDTKIAALKKARAKKLADEAAAEKAAEQSADAAKNLAAQQAGQVVTPKSCAISGPHGNPNNIDVVINKKHCFSPIDFVPSDLGSFNGFVLSTKAIPDATALFAAAAAAGAPLSLTSSYRSYSNQVATYNYWVQANGSTASADTVSARPGYSEHQTGFVFDLSAGSCSLECFAGTPQYAWMQAHAAEYGFIERYPPGLTSITGYSPEAWHYRYVGRTVAQDMKAKGVKTLEQYWGISGGDY